MQVRAGSGAGSGWPEACSSTDIRALRGGLGCDLKVASFGWPGGAQNAGPRRERMAGSMQFYRHPRSAGGGWAVI